MIKSKTVQGLVGGKQAPNIILFLCSDFDEFIFAYVLDDFKKKKCIKIKMSTNFSKTISTNFFSAKLFFIFLEYSETHFYVVASKVGAKLNNLVIYGDNSVIYGYILVNFLIFLSTKSTISQKLKNHMNRKFVFS